MRQPERAEAEPQASLSWHHSGRGTPRACAKPLLRKTTNNASCRLGRYALVCQVEQRAQEPAMRQRHIKTGQSYAWQLERATGVQETIDNHRGPWIDGKPLFLPFQVVEDNTESR